MNLNEFKSERRPYNFWVILHKKVKVGPAQSHHRSVARYRARGSRNIRETGCNLLKRGRNVAKLFCDWLKYSKWFPKDG